MPVIHYHQSDSLSSPQPARMLHRHFHEDLKSTEFDKLYMKFLLDDIKLHKKIKLCAFYMINNLNFNVINVHNLRSILCICVIDRRHGMKF